VTIEEKEKKNESFILPMDNYLLKGLRLKGFSLPAVITRVGVHENAAM
jgi:hypothetical protein